MKFPPRPVQPVQTVLGTAPVSHQTLATVPEPWKEQSPRSIDSPLGELKLSEGIGQKCVILDSLIDSFCLKENV